MSGPARPTRAVRRGASDAQAQPPPGRARARARATVTLDSAPQGVRAERPPTEVRRLRTPDEARELAQQLLGPLRWPVVLVSISAPAPEPYIDATELKREIGDLGEVVVMPTNEVSWAFSDAMPEMTQVYGGAGRVYAVDGAWRTDPYRSTLCFADGRSDSDRVVAALAKDVALAAFHAGTAWSPDYGPVASSASSAARGPVASVGKVARIVGDSRALVNLDDGTYATIWAELTMDDVDITQVVERGQKVHGLLDRESHRLDVRGSLLRPADVLALYRSDMNVLTRVRTVAEHAVVLTLFPGVDITVPRALVTDNPLDKLADLFTQAEVVVARLEAITVDRRGERVNAALRLDTIDDENTAAPTPPILNGGPAWLTLTPPPAPSAPLIAEEHEAVQPAPVVVDSANGPGPGLIPRPRPPVGPTLTARSAQLQELGGLALANRTLEAEISRLTRERDELRTKLRTTGSQRRKAEQLARGAAKGTQADLSNLFADPVEQFRFEVHIEWARRIPAGQKAERPLPDYDIGPDFLGSLEQTNSIDRAKAVAVVVEVLTGIATELDSRGIHPLRAGPSGGAPPVTREGGAVCMRVALQTNTPSARRLHYWSLGKRVELSRVVLHDDMAP